MLTRFLHWLGFGRSFSPVANLNPDTLKPVILTRQKHTLTHANISKHALKVLQRLQEAGFQAYLVGGGVRDGLLGLHPKDFDVATNAHPEEVSALFKNSRHIGRRFRIIHVHFGYHIVEIATFRASPKNDQEDSLHVATHKEGMITRDNLYGSIEEDVLRRDFTINALYYNSIEETITDFVEGLSDLKSKILRMIGDPIKRYREDPVRMLRALRLSAKLGFTLESKTAQGIQESRALLSHVPAARLFDEYLKLFLSGYSQASFKALREFGLFAILFPRTEVILNQNAMASHFIAQALQNTDQRLADDKSVAPYFLLAVFLWFPALEEKNHFLSSHQPSEYLALMLAFDHVLQEQRRHFSIPKRLTQMVRDVWILQLRLKKRGPAQVARTFLHLRFRAAYDFLCLRAETGDKEAEALKQWWTDYIEGDEETRQTMAAMTKESNKKPRKKRKRKPPARSTSDSSLEKPNHS